MNCLVPLEIVAAYVAAGRKMSPRAEMMFFAPGMNRRSFCGVVVSVGFPPVPGTEGAFSASRGRSHTEAVIAALCAECPGEIEAMREKCAPLSRHAKIRVCKKDVPKIIQSL